MSADITTSLANWSTTESSNLPIGTTAISTNLDDNFRMIQAVVRTLASNDTIASATTTDIGTKAAAYIDITGTTTITGLGTISAGIYKFVKFSGALILTHNATSLILPSAANITTAANDTALFWSLGSGNWRCLFYATATGLPVNPALNLADGTAAAPSLYFTADTNTGFYRIGADSLGITTGGVKVGEFSTANGLVVPKAVSLGTGVTPEVQVTSLGVVNITSQATKNINFTSGSSQYFIAGTGGYFNFTPGFGGGFVVPQADGTGVTVGSLVQFTCGNSTLAGAGSFIVSSGYSTGAANGDIDLRIGYNAGSTSKGELIIGQNTVPFYKFNAKGKHVIVVDSSNRPTITSGFGTSPSITGSDNAFQITVGSGGAATSGVVTFNTEWVIAPMCIASHQSAALLVRCTATTTTITLTSATAFTAGSVIDVFCIGRE